MKSGAPTALVILDGFGFSPSNDYNAMAHAQTPVLNNLMGNYPVTLLEASGSAVGLPEGWIGNSEVGHLTIGCGAAIAQSPTIIFNALENESFFTLPALLTSFEKLKEHQGTLHLIGLLSDAGVHGHIDHLVAFLHAAHEQNIARIVIHVITDGRDTAPCQAQQFLESLEKILQDYPEAVLGSLMGRFYGMDRNRNWHLTNYAYQCLTEAQPLPTPSWRTYLEESYKKDLTDEFILPTQLADNVHIKPNDGIIFCNYRPDRARQLTACFTHTPSPLGKPTIPLSFFITPVSYGSEYHTTVLFEKSHVPQTLTAILNEHEYSVLFVAETEKYAHVTYFFNGGRENVFPHEKRVLVPSLSSKNFVTHPGMSADIITEVVIDSLKYQTRDFYVINYANADMIGHTGNFNAVVKAIECLDKQIGILYHEIVEKQGGTLYITSDHGNAEEMFDEQTGQVKTAHTANPVPFIAINKSLYQSGQELPLHELADIAPFILHGMNLD